VREIDLVIAVGNIDAKDVVTSVQGFSLEIEDLLRQICAIAPGGQRRCV
jgi:hypothetical protein